LTKQIAFIALQICNNAAAIKWAYFYSWLDKAKFVGEISVHFVIERYSAWVMAVDMREVALSCGGDPLPNY